MGFFLDRYNEMLERERRYMQWRFAQLQPDKDGKVTVPIPRRYQWMGEPAEKGKP